MVRELERGEDFKTSPLLGREIGQDHIQTVHFQASEKAPSMADSQTLAMPGLDKRKGKHWDPAL
jgi:hypothetical protein